MHNGVLQARDYYIFPEPTWRQINTLKSRLYSLDQAIAECIDNGGDVSPYKQLILHKMLAYLSDLNFRFGTIPTTPLHTWNKLVDALIAEPTDLACVIECQKIFSQGLAGPAEQQDSKFNELLGPAIKAYYNNVVANKRRGYKNLGMNFLVIGATGWSFMPDMPMFGYFSQALFSAACLGGSMLVYSYTLTRFPEVDMVFAQNRSLIRALGNISHTIHTGTEVLNAGLERVNNKAKQYLDKEAVDNIETATNSSRSMVQRLFLPSQPPQTPAATVTITEIETPKAPPEQLSITDRAKRLIGR